MRLNISFKIFGIAVGLLLLMGVAALLSLRMFRTVDDQLAILDHNYFPGYVSLAQANIRSVEESALIRRLVLASGETPRDEAKIADLHERTATAASASDAALAAARQHINEQIGDPLNFGDIVSLARLDTRIEFLQDERRVYEAIFAKLLTAVTDRQPEANALLRQLDDVRDDFNKRIDAAGVEMHQIARNAIVGTRSYQRRIVQIGLGLFVFAALLGLTMAAAVTTGLVRPVRRLLAGTVAVEQGALDTVVPVSSRDEIGRLTQSFNTMVGELQVKAQIRDTFGKYVDPRIVAGLRDVRRCALCIWYGVCSRRASRVYER
jgi:nitrogen fixation/metabolism regulation signal transduction histidine kinase